MQVLRKAGFTRQKLVIFAIPRDEFLREQYVKDMSLYNSDFYGNNRSDAVHKFGYSFKRKIFIQKLLIK